MASTGWRGPSWAISAPSADTAARRQAAASCSAHSSRGIAVGKGRRTCPAGRPCRSNAAARAPEVPTSTATSTSPAAGGWALAGIAGSAADQLVGLDLVLVQGDQRAVQRPGGVVAAGIDDHGAAEPADAGRLVDVAVQAEQRLALQLGVAHRAAADRAVLHLAEDRLHLEVAVEPRRVVELGAQRRRVQVENGPLGAGQPVGVALDGRRELVLGLLPVGVPRGGVRVTPADHLVVVVDPEDLVLAVRAPWGV